MEMAWVKSFLVDFSLSQIDGEALFYQTPIKNVVFLLKVIL